MTGWPAGLMQDDCRELSLWFAHRINARQEARNVAKDIFMSNYEDRFKVTIDPKNQFSQTWTVDRKELYNLLSKAINTVEPQKQPQWAMGLCDALANNVRLSIEIKG